MFLLVFVLLSKRHIILSLKIFTENHDVTTTGINKETISENLFLGLYRSRRNALSNQLQQLIILQIERNFDCA